MMKDGKKGKKANNCRMTMKKERKSLFLQRKRLELDLFLLNGLFLIFFFVQTRKTKEEDVVWRNVDTAIVSS
jgi:hypothetical protein